MLVICARSQHQKRQSVPAATSHPHNNVLRIVNPFGSNKQESKNFGEKVITAQDLSILLHQHLRSKSGRSTKRRGDTTEHRKRLSFSSTHHRPWCTCGLAYLTIFTPSLTYCISAPRPDRLFVTRSTRFVALVAISRGVFFLATVFLFF